MFYPAVVIAFTVRQIIITDAAMHVYYIHPPSNMISLVPRLLCSCRSTCRRSDTEATLSYLLAKGSAVIFRSFSDAKTLSATRIPVPQSLVGSLPFLRMLLKAMMSVVMMLEVLITQFPGKNYPQM